MRFIGKTFVILLSLLGGLFAILLVGAAILLANNPFGREKLPDQMVLDISISDSLPENPTNLLLDNLVAKLSGTPVEMTLFQTLQTLEKASHDPAVKGVFVTVSSGSLGMAQAQELRSALKSLEAAGKKTVVFSETFGEMGNGTIPYYVASSVSDIWLQPSGLVATTGFATRQPFMRAFLDQYGIEPDFAARKAYKSAASSLTDFAMSEAERTALQGVLDGWLSSVVNDVSADRKIPADEVRNLIDRAPLLALEAQKANLVSTLGYREDALEDIYKKSGTTHLVSLSTYANAHTVDVAEKDVKKIVLIAANGQVSIGSGKRTPFSSVMIDSRALATAIDETVADSSVAAIILRINSPGGSYVGADMVWRAIERARKKGMPIIASMGDTAASGGYFIAMGANKIVAEPGTLTGSIGVVSGKVTIQGLSNQLNIHWDGVQAGRNAAIGAISEPFDEAGRQRLNTILDAIYDDFTTKAARSRNMSAEDMEKAAQGRVWIGSDALKMGLVDELGGINQAIGAAHVAAGLSKDTNVQVVFWQPDSRKSVMSLLGGEISALVTLAPTLHDLGALLNAARPVGAALTKGDQGLLYAPNLP